MYVTQKTANSFEVRELGKGTSNVGFDYRIVARRKGYENIRMADKSQTWQDLSEWKHRRELWRPNERCLPAIPSLGKKPLKDGHTL